MAAQHDLVIRKGTVADGRGKEPVEADIAIDGGRITAVGTVGGSGREEIDARGLLVTPGFVDVHSHFDAQVIWDERLLPAGWLGVTTTVMGNCGVGFAPVRETDRETLIQLMEGVEDIPAPVLRAGLTWDWSTFPEYLDALERRPHDMDVCAQVPHSALRVYVMGERAVRREPATGEDIAAMRRLAREAIEAGAFGFSTSLSDNHRTPAGDFIPSHDANAEELSGIACGLTDAGRGVLQAILNLGPDPGEREREFAIMRDMVAASGRPLSLTVLQRIRDPEGWRHIMKMMEASVAEGLPMRAQVIPRPLGTLFGLDMSRHPFCYHPSFKAIADAPLEKKVAAFRDPAFRKRLLAEKAEGVAEDLIKRAQNFDYMFPLGDPPNYAPLRESGIGFRARAEGRSPFEVAFELMLEDDGRAMLFSPNSGYGYFNLEGCRELMENPLSVVGVSDGGAHVASICDSSFSAFLLSYWGRDRGNDRFDLGWLVKRATADTAALVGLNDRGVIAPGYKADINIIDFNRLKLGRPYMVHDLPQGGKRLLQKAKGFVATIVSGTPVYRDGTPTGELPGRLVRGPQAAP
jgi:N-acyl-D-aspartate/D-glutamate deacylase